MAATWYRINARALEKLVYEALHNTEGTLEISGYHSFVCVSLSGLQV
jgi:hypothetical protein